jgi:N-acetyl sugar amidotransferase
MDTTAVDIHFDPDGVCNYCREFDSELRRRESRRGESEGFPGDPETLKRLVQQIRDRGKGKPYDCVSGVSGGADSSWALVQAVDLGLRPLAVHMDNGWNSELAQHNIHALVNKLGVDLYTYVIDWPEYRGLMQAFFDSDVIDIELLYDNAMAAVNFSSARRYSLRYMLSGSNTATEGLRIPPSWNHFKFDKRNIKAIARHAGVGSLRTFPAIGTLRKSFDLGVRRMQWVPLLDYVGYDKLGAVACLVRDYGYKPYPHKHYESVFTRLYMSYILPKKFGVDMRKVDFSALIITGKMERDAALAELQLPAYGSVEARDGDVRYFCRKMGWTHEQFEQYLNRPEVPHFRFASEESLYDAVKRARGMFAAALRRERDPSVAPSSTS